MFAVFSTLRGTSFGPAAEVEVRFVDGSTMKLQMRDDKIELETAYGKLLVPVADVKRIDFGQRIPEETRKKIEAALKDLGSAEFRRRDAAANLLFTLKDKAYPALAQAKGKDTEEERRIEQLLEKIREAVPADVLDVLPYDVVHTANSRIAGRVKSETFRVSTLPFGDQAVKLADMRTLKIGGFGEPEPAALAGGGNVLEGGAMHMFANQIGKTLAFRVTAPPAQLAGNMGVWGSDVYTTDTPLAGAALHAGVLRPGETGVVRVTFVGQHPGFVASMRNGVMSHGYGPYAGYRVEQPKNAPKR
jgi:LCCL domain